MRPTRALLALSLAAAVAPAALAAHPSAPAAPDGHGSDKAPVKQAKGPKGTNYLLHACLTAPAVAATDTADGSLALSVLGGNHHMRVALAGAQTLDAKIDATTFIRLVGKGRTNGKTGKAAGIGSAADLHAGDRVIVRFRAPRTTDAGALPAAWRVIDRGPVAACAVPATTPPQTPTDPAPQPGL